MSSNANGKPPVTGAIAAASERTHAKSLARHDAAAQGRGGAG